VAFSLGFTGGARCVEHLSQVMLETEAVSVRTATLVPNVTTAFEPDGQPGNPVMNLNLSVMLDDLAWLASALKTARSGGELPPSALRIRAAFRR